MPPSQLKRLKQSLREQGITGPQKSKKQKKQSQGQNADQRVRRDAALQQIRDSFNPFEIKASSRTAKFSSMSDRAAPTTISRPGVTKSMGEQTRRQNLLPELQRRNKSGGIVDRRIGEGDATMTPEERALQRFIREKSKRKNGSLFDLEGDDDEGTGLTHLGKALNFGEGGDEVDDFDAGSLAGSDDGSEKDGALLKRRREPTSDSEVILDDDDEEEPAKKKTKQEVMKEVIAKSKLHKYERQQAKEDDDELRAKLDSEMGDMLSLLMGRKPDPPKTNNAPAQGEATMNADRLAMIQGKSREAADKEYDLRLRQMAMDQKAAPADKTMTEEEKAKSEAERLKKLEESRQRRMRGEESEGSGDEKEKVARGGAERGPDEEAEEDRDDAAEFGLSTPRTKSKLPVLDDEDEFELDDDLLASDSEDGSETYDSAEDTGESDDEEDTPKVSRTVAEDEEDEFVRGILDTESTVEKKPSKSAGGTQSVAFTYPCPRSHTELLEVFGTVKDSDIPLIIQRIRALYHPSLSAENKEKLADFSCSLVEHLPYLGRHKGSLQVIETIIRHLHSLSRTFPEKIAGAFRQHLRDMHQRSDIDVGDLVIFTAIGSIYPTSDHFHQVVTPAITLMARWLGMTNPTEGHLVIGANVVALILHYQRLSKRYVPEALRFTLKVLRLSPRPAPGILQIHSTNLINMAEQYRDLSAFPEIFDASVVSALSSIKDTKTLQRLRILLSQSRLARRPLTLHKHRPLPIRTSVPKFEESFAPGKHYDPDKERSDAAKLRKEYKRERKGAMRELRKDANFVAREQLREKKEADQAYEKKFRRLVAEINSEEGRLGNEYAREKERRKKTK
ncbi:hypothetical protein ANO11243_006340 [Dothideomycetidae sp. 11243]|nr:hypothetical protein ANO11243_006340 [fungal sp. No.11243]